MHIVKKQAKHDNQNESAATMLQNAVRTTDGSEHLLSQNEVIVEEPVQFEYFEPSAFCPAVDT